MQDVFAHAQIVLATLSSSLNGQMEHQARFMSQSSPTRRPFEVAIVDEASQCVEPEMLIPMQLGFTKLVGMIKIKTHHFCKLHLLTSIRSSGAGR